MSRTMNRKSNRLKAIAIACVAVMGMAFLGNICPATHGNMLEMASVTASAESAIWDGTADTSWYYREHTVLTNENGDRLDVFDINTAEELAGLAKLVRNGNEMQNTMINLTSDLVMNDTSNFDNWDEQEPANNWIAIGAVDIDAAYAGGGIRTQPNSNSTNFCGIFNGNGHTISGLYSMHHNYAGLFARLSGVVSGVILKDSYIKCVNTQDTEDGTTFWETCAGGIAAICDRGIINCCEFDGKVFASGQDMVGYGMHGCYAGGITGKFSDDGSGVAALVLAFAFVPLGVIVNPAFCMIGLDGQQISDPGIYNCINRGSIYAENGTDCNGAGGIVGTGGLFTFRNPDFAVFYCVNLGEISGNQKVKTGAMVGYGYKFSEQRSYYTNCDRSSDNDEAINFTEAGMSKQEVVEQLSSSFKYEDGEIYLNFDHDTSEIPGDGSEDETVWTVSTETFLPEVEPERNVTMPAPELTCDFISHYFGNAYDKENITVVYSKNPDVCKWIMEVATDPEFTDIQMRTAGNPSTEAYALRPGVTYYIRAYGVNTYGTPDETTEYTGTSYLNVTLEDYSVLTVTVPGETPVLELGDCTGDEAINASDASLILVTSAQIGTGDSSDLTEAQIKAADVNGDGTVNAADAAVVLIYAAEVGAGNVDAKIADFV